MWLRLLITLVALGIASAAQFLTVPGLDFDEFAHMSRIAGHAPDTSLVSVVAMGINPLISAFLVVEMIAVLVPRWRRLRASGPAGRASLRRAGLVLTVLLAAMQGFFLSRWMHQPFDVRPLMREGGIGSQFLVTLSLVGGTFFMIALTELIDRYGVGCGISCFLAGKALGDLADLAVIRIRDLHGGVVTGADLGKEGLLVAVVAAASWWILTAHTRREPWQAPVPTSLRHPMSGVWPLTLAASLLAMPRQLAAFGLDVGALRDLAPGRPPYAFVYGGLVLVAGVVSSLIFYRRRLLLPVLGRLVKGAPETGLDGPELVGRLTRAGLARTLIFLLVVTAIGGALAAGPGRRWPEPIGIVLIVAVALDVIGEWRARRKHRRLVPVWPLNQVALVQPVLDALERAGIFALPRSAFHRALLQFFGPYVPVVLLVPEARATEARETVEAIVLGDPAGDAAPPEGGLAA
jgi:hypothetical protein